MDSDALNKKVDDMLMFRYIESGATNYIELYLANGGDPNIRNEEGESLLHMAVLHHRHFAVKVLINHHADINLTTPNGLTPLHYAAQIDNSENMIELLIKLGANIDAQDNNGRTPLMQCSVQI